MGKLFFGYFIQLFQFFIFLLRKTTSVINDNISPGTNFQGTLDELLIFDVLITGSEVEDGCTEVPEEIELVALDVSVVGAVGI